jgi:hypothetical protein
LQKEGLPVQRGTKHTAESIAKMRRSAGHKHDDETRARISASHKRRQRLIKKLLERNEAEQASA